MNIRKTDVISSSKLWVVTPKAQFDGLADRSINNRYKRQIL
jgi:hypothetical protein